MRKMNRQIKHIAVVISIVIALVMLVNDGYAFFIFGTDYFKNADLGVDDIYASNTSFDDDDDSFYKVYFFASPYYTTGSGDTPTLDEDPLTIANSESNPYNNYTDTYCTIGASKGENFSNAFYKDSSGNVTGNHYITYKKNNVEYLTGNYGDLELFNVRDFTGYIRANEELKIEQTYTYVCADFKGSISSNYLSGIIAATEFKDAFGFGPEFIGWTYDKEASFYRTVYQGSSNDTGTGTGTSTSYIRYSTGLELYKCDTRGYGYGGTIAEEIGNYGVQGTIDQVTAETSLEYLDSLTDDGSEKGDHIIYLYPVFSEKNYSSSKKFYDSVAFGGAAAPMIKFRVNSGDAYQYKQSEEIDYTQNRYTTCFFIESLNSEKSNPNYYTGNFYLDNDSHIQLDFDDWSGTWVTILDDEELDALGLENGYYNIDISFWHNGSDGTENTETAYKESNKYLKILSGAVLSGYSWTCYYVIGIQKVEDFYFNVYNFGEDSTVKTADLRITPEINDKLYYLVDNVYLKEGQVLSFSNSNINTLGAISTDDLLNYNSNKSETAYKKPGTAETDIANIKLSDNKITVSKSGHYSFIALINYQDGVASSATIAYKENDVKYHLIIYKYDSIYDSNGDVIDNTVFLDINHESIYASYSGYGNSYLTNETVITYNDTNKSSVKVEEIYKGYVLVDTATGLEIPYSVFENGVFYLNRSYVLYFKGKSNM